MTNMCGDNRSSCHPSINMTVHRKQYDTIRMFYVYICVSKIWQSGRH